MKGFILILSELHYIYPTTIKCGITACYRHKETLADYLADEKHFGAWGEVTPSPKTTPQLAYFVPVKGSKIAPPLVK